MSPAVAAFTLGALFGLPSGYALGWLTDPRQIVATTMRLSAGLLGWAWAVFSFNREVSRDVTSLAHGIDLKTKP